MTREERLAEFFRRLLRAPPQNTAAEAKWLLAVTLNAVEDELTDIPGNSAGYANDGRMYPIPADTWDELPNGSFIGRTRAQRIIVASNGAIEIRRRSNGDVLLRKAGADGQGVE